MGAPAGRGYVVFGFICLVLGLLLFRYWARTASGKEALDRLLGHLHDVLGTVIQIPEGARVTVGGEPRTPLAHVVTAPVACTSLA